MSSSFYEDASLVMIPSGYKTSKVYCAKPTDGAGDLSFTRSNDTATRVNSAGLIEKVRTNLLLQSVWPNIGTGVAPTSWLVGTGPATSFSAGPLAGQLLCNTSASRGFITQSVSLTAGEYALSVFVDSVTTTNSVADLILIFGSTNRKYYEDGVEVNLNTNVVAGKRYAMVGTVTTGSFSMRIGSGVNANATANYVISRPQLEVSDFGATAYIPTTTAAVSVGPVANVPRLDYLGSSCPRLLLEPQRTNLVLYSESFDNAAWTKENATITANAVTSPSGYQDADTLTDNSTSGRHRVAQTMSATNGTTYTYSVFVKKNSSGRFLLINAATLFNARAALNLDTLDVTNLNGTGKVEDYGNGWYRFSVTGTATATSTTATYIQMQNSASDVNYVGDGSSFYLWGAQLEQGSYSTSLIPTLGAAVTRGADTASKTGISSLIGQTEGTIYIDVDNNETETSCIISTNAGAGSASHIYIGQNGSNLSLYIRSAFTYSIIAANIANIIGRKKIALAYGASFARIYMNGTQIFNSTAAVIPSGLDRIEINVFNINTDIGNQKCKEVLYFKSKLTDAQLAELTTL